MIAGGESPRAAFHATMPLSLDEAYVRNVDQLRAEHDTTWSALADGAPRLLAAVAPIYPAELAAARTTGSVTVRFVVSTDGSVGSCEIVASDHPAFSAAVIEAVQRWSFQPGIKDGRAVAAQMQVSIPFLIRK